MEFSQTTTRYGDKLQIAFDYDKELIEDIKDCNWEYTHRSWNGSAWTIDLARNSIKEFEHCTGITVPAKYKYELDMETGFEEGAVVEDQAVGDLGLIRRVDGEEVDIYWGDGLLDETLLYDAVRTVELVE